MTYWKDWQPEEATDDQLVEQWNRAFEAFDETDDADERHRILGFCLEIEIEQVRRKEVKAG